MNQTPQKNVKIGNKIIDLNEVIYISFVEKDLKDGGPQIYIRFKGNVQEVISFNNQELFYIVKTNLIKLKNPLSIDEELFNSPQDHYLEKNKF